MIDPHLDEKFGLPRPPEKVDSWEDRAPDSLSVFNNDVGTNLKKLEELVQSKLFRSAARAKNYIWAMSESGDIMLAVEELALQQPTATYSGYPRRRGSSHPAEGKKLGHPTLLNNGKARIAGELAFDDIDGRLRWVMNVNSGRYCRQFPPNDDQIQNLANRFTDLGLDVVIDYD